MTFYGGVINNPDVEFFNNLGNKRNTSSVSTFFGSVKVLVITQKEDAENYIRNHVNSDKYDKFAANLIDPWTAKPNEKNYTTFGFVRNGHSTNPETTVALALVNGISKDSVKQAVVITEELLRTIGNMFNNNSGNVSLWVNSLPDLSQFVHDEIVSQNDCARVIAQEQARNR